MSCPPKSDIAKAEAIPNTVGTMAAAAGIESCKTSGSNDSTEFKLEAEIDAMLVSGSASAQGKTQSVKSNSVGCEQVAAIAKATVDVTDKIKCTLNESRGSISNNAKAFNSINFAADNVNIKCGAGGLNIDQRNKIKINTSAAITNQQMNTMVTDMVNTIKDTTDILLSSKTGFAATPQGQKTLQDISAKTVTGDFQAQIKKSINEISNVAEAGNSFTLGPGPGKNFPTSITIDGGNCQINQSNILEIMASMIVNDVLSNAFQDYKTQSTEFMNNVISEAESEGQPEIEPLKSMFESQGEARAKWLTPLIIGIVVIVVAIIVGIIAKVVLKSGSNKEVANKVGGILKLYKLFTHAY